MVPASKRVAYALELSEIAGAVAHYCDRVEHNEEAQREWVLDAAARTRELGWTLAEALGVDLVRAYGERLGAIERRNVLHHAADFDGPAAVRAVVTWRDLQSVQARHDAAYHSDVVGLAKIEQLRHYALHLAKLAAAFARFAKDEPVEEEILKRRLPDLLLFGIKLSTVMGQPLQEAALSVRGMPSRLQAV
jgi:hypothetical protein